MAPLQNSRTSFVSPDGSSTLTVHARQGKKGINVAVSVKTAGEKAKTGCRATYDTPAEADKAFQSLSASALKRGWTAAAAKEKKSNVGAFAEIPAAPTTPAAKAGK